jgi:hypothetical protein
MDPFPAPPPARTGTPRRRVARWLGWALAALALAALATAAFAWLARQRLTGELAAQVAYEDKQARLGAVALVLAVQAADDAAWRDQRAAETTLGLPAPLPVENLLPTDAAAQVRSVIAVEADIYAVVVQRQYADSTGAAFAFELTQRYRRLAPGLWERLPPDPASLALLTSFTGQRLNANLPVGDADTLLPVLEQADLALSRVCAEWAMCALGLKLMVDFTATDEMAHLRAPLRPAAPIPGGYPLILDLPMVPRGADGTYRLPAPSLAGRPADAAAQAAYTRALTAQLLGLLAGEAAGRPRSATDYFLDAIVARAEARLGLSSGGAGGWQPYDYVSPDNLWQQTRPLYSGPAAGLAERQQVVELMTLAGLSAADEGRLLANTRRADAGGLVNWLGQIIGRPAALRLVQDRKARLQASLPAPGPDDWALAEGLTLACADGLSVVRAGAPRLVLPEAMGAGQLRAGERLFAEDRLFPGEWSPDGRYLALTVVYPTRVASSTPSTGLAVLDAATGAVTAVARAEGMFDLGWSAEGELLFVRYAPEAGDMTSLSLLGYHPATGALRNLLPDSVRLFSLAASSWSVDHGALALTVSPIPPYTSAAIVTLGPEAVVQALGEQGYAFAPVFAPGSTPTGGRAAFLTGAQAGFPVGAWELNVIDLATQAVSTVLKSADLVGGSTDVVFAIEWSPDGKHIVFQVAPEGRFVAVTPETGQWRDWTGVPGVPADFSADGRHLMAMESTGVGQMLVYSLLELDAVPDAPAHRFVARGVVWSPAGHRLALANDLGVFVLDPDTQAYAWLRAGACRLSW